MTALSALRSHSTITITFQFSSVTESCPTLCDPMNHSTPGLHVRHQLPEFTQTHVHLVSDVIQPSYPLSPHSPPTLNRSQPQSFPTSQLFTSGGQSIEASASVLPVDIQGWFPLGFTWYPCCSRDFQECSPAPQFKTINSSAFSLLYGSTFTSVHDYWKNHSFDYADLCQQSDVSDF